MLAGVPADVTVECDAVPSAASPTATDNDYTVGEDDSSTVIGNALTDNTGDGVDSDPDGDPVTVLWDFGDGGTSSERNPSHTYSAPGNYTVTLTVEDDQSATDSTSATVTSFV